MTSRPDRHGWNSWEQYQNAHDSHMRAFNGFVVEDNLVPVPTNVLVVWDGRIFCSDGFTHSHHKHRCDEMGNEIYPPDFVGADNWPMLSDALEELRQMWLRWQESRGNG